MPCEAFDPHGGGELERVEYRLRGQAVGVYDHRYIKAALYIIGIRVMLGVVEPCNGVRSAETACKAAAEHICVIVCRGSDKKLRRGYFGTLERFDIRSRSVDTHDIVVVAYAAHDLGVTVYDTNRMSFFGEIFKDASSYLAASDYYNFHCFTIFQVRVYHFRHINGIRTSKNDIKITLKRSKILLFVSQPMC